MNISAYSTRRQSPTLIAYTASKTAMTSMSKNLAQSLAPDGILVNTVSPGSFLSEGMRAYLGAQPPQRGIDPDSLEDAMRVIDEDFGHPAFLPRAGDPHEIGPLIAFLVSQRNTYMTGAEHQRRRRVGLLTGGSDSTDGDDRDREHDRQMGLRESTRSAARVVRVVAHPSLHHDDTFRAKALRLLACEVRDEPPVGTHDAPPRDVVRGPTRAARPPPGRGPGSRLPPRPTRTSTCRRVGAARAPRALQSSRWVTARAYETGPTAMCRGSRLRRPVGGPDRGSGGDGLGHRPPGTDGGSCSRGTSRRPCRSRPAGR